MGRSRQICTPSFIPRHWDATYPDRNAGLTLLQKESRYSPSEEEIFPSQVRSEQDFAPTGNPQRNPYALSVGSFFGSAFSSRHGALFFWRHLRPVSDKMHDPVTELVFLPLYNRKADYRNGNQLICFLLSEIVLLKDSYSICP